jgi:hypothetical protein
MVARSPEGCQITRKLRKEGGSIFYDSIQYTVPNKDICGGRSYEYKFSRDGNQITVKTSLNEEAVINLLSKTLWRIDYKDPKGGKWVIEVEAANPSSGAKNQKSLSSLSHTYQKSSMTCSSNNTSLESKQITLIASACSGSDPIEGMHCDVCKMGDQLLGFEEDAYGKVADTAGIANTTERLLQTPWSFGVRTKIIEAPFAANELYDPIGTETQGQYTGSLGGGFKKWVDDHLVKPIRQNLREGLTEALNCSPSPCEKLAQQQRACKEQTANQPSQQTPNSSQSSQSTQVVTRPTQIRHQGPLRQGKSYGDPHIVTFDGYRYSFQTVGEFVLVQAKDGGFRVQVRQGAVPGRQLSLNTGVAMQVGNSRVAVYSKDFPDGNANTPVWVDGRPVNLEGSLELSGGGSIQGGNGNYLVQWQTGEQVGISKLSVAGMEFMNVTPAVPEQAGRYVGLLGDLDDNPENDLQKRDGQVILTKDNSTYGILKQALGNLGAIPLPLSQIETAFFEQLYREFGDSWRISQAESLFAYGPGQSTESFTNRGFPSSFSTLGSLLPPQLRQAEEICRQAGVPGDLLEGCIFDVGNTGEGGFAQAALNTVLDEVKNRVEAEIRNRIPIPVPIPLPF